MDECKDTWYPFFWYCPNCGTQLIGFKNAEGMIKGIPYYRTRVKDADGKRVSLYARTEKELVVKLAMARGVIEGAKFRKYNPTVAEYTEKWLVMQSAHIQPSTLDGYAYAARKYIIEPLGDNASYQRDNQKNGFPRKPGEVFF